MTSSQTRATIASSTPVTARSLFSRWKAPLSSKSRSHTEFYIQPDDPHRQYNPGDIISGTVIVKVLKPLRITHLVVSLHGYAQVFKNPNAPGDAYKNYCATVGSGRGKKSGSYFGNGFASLFEDEVVLCGEGMLNEGVYHFNFELEFPAKDLPSSIDFERGTVTYMLTATLTRPTTISPTTSHNTNVSLMNLIDIASIPEPKPRIISLEPVSRRARTKPSRNRPVALNIGGGRQTPNGQDGPRNAPTGEVIGSHSEHDGPRSPSPSDVSFESQISSGNASGTEYGVRSANTEAMSSSTSEKRNSLKGKIITASIDVLKGGFLRGDQIPIRITVNHTKHVRSLKGVIVTLYRQAKVDMHPVLPVAPNSKGDKTKSEEYYPKSRTGLGGLSLSSAGSSHLFRKDLCQSFAPLFIDPRTLTAEVKCAVRVPDEAFPTISNVPGAMISFKYYVEVIVDIQGKLSGLDRMVEQASLLNVPSTAVGNTGPARDDSTSNIFTTWGANVIDTDQIRREKNIISALFEVVIGTKDSERNGKRKQVEGPPSNSHQDTPEIQSNRSIDTNGVNGYDQLHYEFDEIGQNYDPAYYDVPEYDQHGAGPSASYSLPPASTEDEQVLSEKERMRRAEARLLPSEPPRITGPPASEVAQHSVVPSAPYLPDDEDEVYQNPASLPPDLSSSMSSHPNPLSHATTSSSQRRIVDLINDGPRRATTGPLRTINDNSQGSSRFASSEAGHVKPLPALPLSTSRAFGEIPAYSISSTPHVLPTDDKQELQRRRLEMERSAPPEDEEEEEAGPSQQHSTLAISSTRGGRMAPTAPALEENDEDLVGAVRPGRSIQENINENRRESDVLPKYQR